jgi:raffinose/stachyose/melibiose transport system substrate-binding protein
MKAATVLNLIGVALLLGSFAASVATVATRSVREADPNQVTLRMCHWQLEAGMRDAFDAVAREYSRLHPNVRIEQIGVPGRVYGSYTRTRLAGENVPDLVEGGSQADDLLTRHFVPLTRYVEQPNPYNAGTDLEGVPWRETFIDGLGNAPGLETLQEYYAIPNSIVTVRVYYNKPLYRAIMGHDEPPRDYEAFLEVCRKAQAHIGPDGRPVQPLAGSRFNANILLDNLFRSQTQRLALEIDELRQLRPPAHPALAFLGDRVTLDHPAIRDGLELMREVGVMMPAGFLQLDREDAIFYFAQQRALMIVTGSWDYRSIADQSPFELGVFPIPRPTPDHPTHGRHTLGPVAEGGQGLGVNFFVSNVSEHPEVAIDFLRFLTSRRGHEIFVRVSKWLPAIVGVEPAEETAAFRPIPEGYTDGFHIAPIMWGSGEMYRVQSNHLHRLLTPGGSVEEFLSLMRSELPAAVRADAMRLAKSYDENVRRFDSTLTALRRLDESDDGRGKLSGGWETQNAQESNLYWLQHQLSQAER